MHIPHIIRNVSMVDKTPVGSNVRKHDIDTREPIREQMIPHIDGDVVEPNRIIPIPQIEVRLLIERKRDDFVLPLPNDCGYVKTNDSIPSEFQIECDGIVTASGNDGKPFDLKSDYQWLPLSHAKCTVKWSVVRTKDDCEVEFKLSPYPASASGFTTSLQIEDVNIVMMCRFSGTSDAWRTHLMYELPHTQAMSNNLWDVMTLEASPLFDRNDSGICGCPCVLGMSPSPSHRRPWIEPEVLGRGRVCAHHFLYNKKGY